MFSFRIDQDEEDYRQSLALEREAASSKKRKSISAQHAQLARETGLSGQVVALMAGRRDSDDDDNSKSEDSRSDTSRRRKKKRKRKRTKEKRHGTPNEKESKKERERERKERKRAENPVFGGGILYC